jgi:NADPH-dependent 7-cyano-7-deazaguanine reductase QueF-like protein
MAAKFWLVKLWLGTKKALSPSYNSSLLMGKSEVTGRCKAYLLGTEYVTPEVQGWDVYHLSLIQNSGADQNMGLIGCVRRR